MKRTFAKMIRPGAIAADGPIDGVNLAGFTVRATHTGRAFAWRTTLASAERDAFASDAGDLLGQLGYEP